MSKSVEINCSDQLNLKIAQLNILQNIIARMANYILAIQITTIVVMLALLFISLTVEISFRWWFFLIPWLGFMLYHAYFFKLELAFRHLYDQTVDKDDICIADFKIDKTTLVQIPPSFIQILFSKSLLTFHIALLMFISLLYFA